MKTVKLLILLCLFLVISYSGCSNSFAQSVDKVYGLTLDAVNNLSQIDTALKRLSHKPTTRIVFDEQVSPSEYTNAVNEISKYSFIMGELLDSYYLKTYSVSQYSARISQYINYSFASKVNIWEIGNEVNGDWCGKVSDVAKKVDNAYYLVKAKGYKTALTLYYNNNVDGCECKSAYDIWNWINNNLSITLKNGLDYVLISYYEDDCNNHQPNWQAVFDKLHTIFPNSLIGIGECGTKKSTKKKNYIQRYYDMDITTPNYIGGYFWWYGKQDFVPYTKNLWTIFNNVIQQ